MKLQMTNARSVNQMRGFTLIELMIVIAIIAILVALAVPAYKDYTIRSKIAECVNGAAVAKIQISEFTQSLGSWPATVADAGIDTPSGSSRFCTGFTNYDSSTGAFDIDVNEAAVDPIIIGGIAPRLTPTFNSGSQTIDWRCTLGSTSAANYKYLPATCRNT